MSCPAWQEPVPSARMLSLRRLSFYPTSTLTLSLGSELLPAHPSLAQDGPSGRPGGLNSPNVAQSTMRGRSRSSKPLPDAPPLAAVRRRCEAWKTFFHWRHALPSVVDQSLVNLASPQDPYDGLTLCSRCSSIELAPRSARKNATGDSIGTIDELFESQRHCPFCRMAFLFLKRLGYSPESGRNNRLDVIVKVASVVQCFSLHRGPRTLSVLDVSYCSPEDPEYRDLPFPLDQLRPFVQARHFDEEAVRRWLQECETEHLTKCKDGAGRLQVQHFPILLIDTLEMRIAEAHTGFRYLALSYVWGGTQTLNLTIGNRLSMAERGSLTKLIDQVPRVIQDAIKITRRIQERYLWVDSLCIPQDDDQFKNTQISQMHSIYSQAALTIVAMAVKSVGEPLLLPCDTVATVSELEGILKQIEKRFKIKIRSVTKGDASTGDLRLSLTRSVYESRGWTFQERLLSRRCLYLAGHQIFFDCPSYLQTSFGFKFSQRDTSSVATIWRLPSSKSTEPQLWDRDFGGYKNLVERYTSKQLTYLPDIFRAFSGILASLRYLHTDYQVPSYICGLPIKFLEMALYWRGDGDLKPRLVLPISINETIMTTPSWSGVAGLELCRTMVQLALIPSIQPFAGLQSQDNGRDGLQIALTLVPCRRISHSTGHIQSLRLTSTGPKPARFTSGPTRLGGQISHWNHSQPHLMAHR